MSARQWGAYNGSAAIYIGALEAADAVPGNQSQLCGTCVTRKRAREGGAKAVTGAVLQEHVAGGLGRVNAYTWSSVSLAQ